VCGARNIGLYKTHQIRGKKQNDSIAIIKYSMYIYVVSFRLYILVLSSLLLATSLESTYICETIEYETIENIIIDTEVEQDVEFVMDDLIESNNSYSVDLPESIASRLLCIIACASLHITNPPPELI